jgi:hypothetical protein
MHTYIAFLCVCFKKSRDTNVIKMSVMPSTLYSLSIVYVTCVAEQHELRRYIQFQGFGKLLYWYYYTQFYFLQPTWIVSLALTFWDSQLVTWCCKFTTVVIHVAEKLEFEMLMQMGLNNKWTITIKILLVTALDYNKIVMITIFFLLQVRTSTKLSNHNSSSGRSGL